MLNRAVKYLLLAAVWGGVVAYILYAAALSAPRRTAQVVESINIDIADSTAKGSLLNSTRILKMLTQRGLVRLGDSLHRVELSRLEGAIAESRAVRSVVAYTNSLGELHIRVKQHRAKARFLADGNNSYITEDGYVFDAPPFTSLYLPVITGDYKPPFPRGYQGDVLMWIEAQLELCDSVILALERSKLPIHKEQDDYLDEYLKVRNTYLKHRVWSGKSREEFEADVDALRKKKRAKLKEYRYRKRVIAEKLSKIEQLQADEQEKQKKLLKNYEDFTKLITFVETIEDDEFWAAEIVQITARNSASGALEIELIPRSGSARILFGRVEKVEQKLSKIERFYRDGLSKVGWDRYQTIDIRYKGQVVCRKK